MHGICQTNSTINATLNDDEKVISIEQTIEYFNESNDTLTQIHLMDWANAFSSKSTPLANRFLEDFRRGFHFSYESERGGTNISHIKSNTDIAYNWSRKKEHPDVIIVNLTEQLEPKASVLLNLKYKVKIADDKFTDYGYTKNGVSLRYWHLAPALYTDKWESYSHKNLNDFTSTNCNYKVVLNTKKREPLESNLFITKEQTTESGYQYELNGEHTSNVKLFIDRNINFHFTTVDNTTIVSNIPFDTISRDSANSLIEKVYHFLIEYYGIPPQSKIMLDNIEYKKQPVYGFNQLPEFLRPFKKEFHYEIITLKQMARALGKQNLKTNLRTDQWITDAIQLYAMINYVETYFPDTKLAGRLHKIFGIRWFHASQIPFNDQYYTGYRNMPARFLQQTLATPKDSLLKFNYNISNVYKAGMGLNYLNSYTESPNAIKSNIRSIIEENKFQHITSKKFTNALKASTDKDIDWFINGFINDNEIVDYKIKKIKRSKDSISVTIKNKGKAVPVKLTGLKKKQVVSQQWLPLFDDTLSTKFARSQFDQFVIDYDEKLPEANRRNNYYKVKGLLNKKIQFRLFQDIENPEYHQIFTVPDWGFNVYDGILLGSSFANKALIRKNLSLNFSPKYGLLSQKILGSASIAYTHQFKENGWYLFTSSLSGRTSSFAEDLAFTSFTPRISLSFRPKDLRSNLGKTVSLRYTSIQREEGEDVELPTPNYNILVARFNHSESYLNKVFTYGLEFQQAENFNKLTAILNYRKLFSNKQQVNLRLFAGTFINNKSIQENDDFFSFALDRPTDYLFQYPYLARSDDSGIASQEFITAEGNFKSQLDVRFANEWLVTGTVESSIWNWIYGYADGGLVKNRFEDPLWQYDSGIKFNLVQDFFELYFPLQSSIGFEPGLPNYEQRIRFKVALSIDTLSRLFTRQWY